MGLLDQIGRLLNRGRAAGGITTSTLGARPRERSDASSTTWLTELRAARDRKALVQACRIMYESDPRAEQAQSTLARDMVRGGFDVEITEGPAEQRAAAGEAVEALRGRLNLDQRLDDWVRLALRDGDTFLELSVDESLAIVEATRKPTLEVRRASNSHDQFSDPQRAFWQGPEWANDAEPPPDAVWFAEWQIIHARWHHDEGKRYGRPLFGSGEKAFKRVEAGETDMAVRRKTRAGLKYVHEFPAGTDPSVIEEYKLLNRDALDNPTAAIADFFGTVKVGVVQGDAQLGQNDDVMHHIRTWFMASPVAMSLLGYGQDLNRDVLEKQEEQYQRALEGLSPWVAVEILKPLLERQWLLLGIWPDGLKYKIKWRAKAPVTPEGVERAANAGLKLKALGVEQAKVLAVIEQLLPGVDLGKAEESSPAANPTAPANEIQETRARPGRIAQAAAELQGVLR